MSLESCYNYKKVSSKITTSGIVPKNVLQLMANDGYEVVINLLPENHKKSVPEEKEIIEAQDIYYVNIPVEFNTPKQEDLEKFIIEIKKNIGKKVHIHCAANWRVSVFYGVYAFHNGLWNKEEANQFILSIWNPAEHPAWSTFLNHFGLGLSE